MSICVGVDVGGTRVKAGVVDAQGCVLARTTRPTPAAHTPARELEDVVVDVVAELLAVEPCAHAVGVGAAGLVDARRGSVVFAPHLAWRDASVRDVLSERLGLPVVVDNDANAAAWAEHRFGAGRGESHLLVVNLGTGIGAAIITQGHLLRGRHGLAGELGHQQVVPDGRRCECGLRGCWEQYCSGSALGRLGRQILRSGGPGAVTLGAVGGHDPDLPTGEHVTRAAQAGDPECTHALAQVGRWLGVGVAGAVAALDPGRVVVGGGVAEAGELLLAPARAALAEHLVGRGHRPVPHLVAAGLGMDAGLVGAAELARSSVEGGGG